MSYSDDYCPEYFGPEYVRPAGAACPNCGCCTKRLCELAASKPVLEQNCAYHGERSQWDQLTGCPCPRKTWTDAQRDGKACVFCAKAVDENDRAKTHRIGMNGGLVSACVPCMDGYRAALAAGGAR